MITASQHFRSQHGEDQWIHEHWSELGLPNWGGYFFEAGAADGETFSNTYWLEHEHEWVGMLCEPDPRHVLLQATRPASVIERCAVGPMDSSVSLGMSDDPFLSGELRDDAVHRVRVEQFTISSLLEKHRVKQLDLLSLDTEGTELQAFQSLDLSRWRPRICVIELETWGLANHSAEMLACMDRSDYEMVHRTRCNGIFRCTR